MNYIVFDLEFNQAYDFKNNKKGISEKDCQFEVIQIGAVKLDDKFNEIDRFNILIKPVIYKRLHPFVKKITKINTKLLNEGVSFEEAYNMFIDFIGPDLLNNTLCVWGKSDIKFLIQNILYYKLSIKNLPKKYIDVQQEAGKFFNTPTKQLLGLENTVRKLNIATNLNFHDALSDAIYTAYILLKVNDNLNIKNISLSKQKEITEVKGPVDLKKLYDYVEKELFKTKLSKREKNIVKAIYFLGLNKVFNKK